ncbi:MAG: PEGA domain-containing protein [Candidatus Aminicenantes bacterium]|nr:PEGA domain-containing protein [Candidatus Aminicenantes bacterium]
MKKIFALLVVIGLVATGCATLFKGASEEVRMESKPSGAEVWIDGQKIGTTPVSLKLESKKTYNIEFKLDGKAKTFRLTNHMAAGYLILDILAGLVPVIVDAATGAWMKLDTNNVIVDIDWPMDAHPSPIQ